MNGVLYPLGHDTAEKLGLNLSDSLAQRAAAEFDDCRSEDLVMDSLFASWGRKR